MLPEENQNIALSDREKLLEQALCSIMKLTDEEKLRVLSKYAERYGFSL